MPGQEDLKKNLKQIMLKKSYTYPKSKNIRKIKCSGAKKK
jgi:hypothetical protein